MEKKYYIIPTIKVKEIEVESLMAGESLPVDDETPMDGGDAESKPLYNDFNVWDK